MQRISYDPGDGSPVVIFLPQASDDNGGGDNGGGDNGGGDNGGGDNGGGDNGGGGGPVLVPPVAPTEVSAVAAQDGTSADVSWFDASDNESEFRVELGESDGTIKTVALPAGSTRTTFSGLTPSTLYGVRVSAVNAAGVTPAVNPGGGSFLAFSTPAAEPPHDDNGDPLTPTPGGPAVSTIVEATANKYLAPAVGMVAAKVSSADDRVATVSMYIDGKLDRTQRGDAPPFNFSFSELPAGAHTFHVVATDSKGRRGVAVRKIQAVDAPASPRILTATPGTLQKLLDSAAPGDVVVVQGKHVGQFKVTRGGAEGLPVQIRFDAGASIDARGKPFALTPADPTKPSSTRWVALADPNIIGASNGDGGHNAALIFGDDWTCVGGVVSGVDGTGVGMSGVRCSAFGLRAEKNGQNGISSTKGRFVALVGCSSIGNNTKKNNPASEGGGGKFARTSVTIVDNCRFAENIGPGLWHDINNADYVVARSQFIHNVKRDAGKEWQGAAYRTEISQGPGCVCDNVMTANDGAGCSIDEAVDFTMYGNYVRDGGQGAEFRNLKRTDNDNAIRRVRVINNTFVNLKRGVATSDSSAPGYAWNTSRVKDWEMTIDGNKYQNVAAPIVWAGKTYKGKTDFGVEPNGVFA